MARYACVIKGSNGVLYYDESTPEQDKMDDGTCSFGGNGYLRFWKACKEYANDFRTMAQALDGTRHIKHDYPELCAMIGTGQITATIFDLDSDEEREI